MFWSMKLPLSHFCHRRGEGKRERERKGKKEVGERKKIEGRMKKEEEEGKG